MARNSDLSTMVPMVRIHAGAEAPHECCGVIVRRVDGELQYMPCRNVANERDRFAMHPQDLIAAEQAGTPVAYAHSHVYTSPVPTDADRDWMSRTGLPWLIVNHPTGSFTINDPAPFIAPLTGRTFVHGVHDCYGIIRDYYATELGIALTDYPRKWGWWEHTDGPDLYRENFAREGLTAVWDHASPEAEGIDADALRLLRPHDVILMRIRTPRENHAAVYVGGNVLLHHLIDQPSRREYYGEFYQRRTTAILRHRNFMQEG
ncbi:C40 family peptidase [Paraburkholderia adhaesiva]|uniref:C40 family peptidase n=1 Tax=Paraburkholderia adhaesiva TaxID=2883244 RepID=UPI001F3200CE|nr:C40 family peptidase [Paraburkholderia adhaesiva]